MSADLLSESNDADWSRAFAKRNSMEFELADAIANPWAKGLSMRVIYALANARVLTRAEVAERGYDGLIRVRNLGPKGIAFIRDRLSATRPIDPFARVRQLVERISARGNVHDSNDAGDLAAILLICGENHVRQEFEKWVGPLVGPCGTDSLGEKR